MHKKKLPVKKKRRSSGFLVKTFRGFTLIELLVVSTIIIIMMSIILVGFSRSSVSARDARRQQDIAMVRQAVESYYEVYGTYPVASTFSQLMNDSQFAPYVANTKIQDPKNSGSFVYTYTSNGSTYTLNYQTEAGGSQQSSGLTQPGTNTPTPVPTATTGPTSTPTRTLTPTRTPTPTPCVVPTGWSGMFDPCTGQSVR